MGLQWTPPQDPFLQNLGRDQTKDGIEEKIQEIGQKNKTLVERLLENEGEMFAQNLFHLLDLLVTNCEWLLDEDTQNHKNTLVKYSVLLRTLKVTKDVSLQKLLLHFFVKGKADLQTRP